MKAIIDPFSYKNSIYNLIENAKEFIFIISYTSNLNSHQINKLRWASQRGVEINLLVGKELDPVTINTLKICPRFYIGYNKKIHCKIYCNESSAIIGSMNFSRIDFNGMHEAGALISKPNYTDTIDEYIQYSKKIKLESIELSLPKIQEKEYARALSVNLFGHCTYCKKHMGLTYKKFLCSKCTEFFKTAPNVKKEDRLVFCHYCGNPLQTKMEKPICLDCSINKYSGFV